MEANKMRCVKKVLGLFLAAAMSVSLVPMAFAEENGVYTNDFSSAALDDFQIVGGTAEVADGKLKVTGGGNAAAVYKAQKYKNFILETDLSLDGGESVGVWFRIGDAANIEAGSYNVNFQFDVGDKANDKIQAGYFPWDDGKVDWMNWLNVADKTGNKTGTFHLKVVMIGGTVSVYTDEVYRGSYMAYNLGEDKYAEGYVGLGGWNFTGLFDNLKITALPDDEAAIGTFELDETPLHSFDFSEALGDDWTVSQADKIAVADGKLAFTGTEGDQYALFNTPITETAYCVEVKFIHEAGNIGLVNRATAAGEDAQANPFKALAYTFDGGLTKLTKYPYEEFVITKPFEVVPGSENVMRIYVNGSVTDVFINDVHVLGYNDTTVTGNLIGLIGWNAKCTFDDLTVYKVKSDAPAPTTPPTPPAPTPSTNPTSPGTGVTPVLPAALLLTAAGLGVVVFTAKKMRNV